MNEEEIFHQALARSSPEERAAYLDQACAGDPALRASVEALLRANVGASGFLDQAAPGPVATVDEQPVRERPGAVIGPYKLIEQIGEGGMGTVWMAQQTEPVKRLVAVKLIKAGMDSRQVIARFEAERQALALMDHPNIARVLDAGATAAGRPYFVMDLVKGVPITRYCDEHRLTPRQRLELFIPVCQAVQHAHQKGIIHRDLKPSNVLVALYDGKPVPKVIDFGVAKAAGQPLTEKTLVTSFGAIVGTVEYMSPEQAEINQLDIDTRSDIYSLGVLLYELLTGTTPFTKKDLEKAGMLEMLRMIREQEPSKPSTKLSTAEGLPTLAANRGTDPAKLTRLVRGELDWIVMKALEKDRSRRYETANGFAMDVQRYLADETVQACPPSAGYRLRKFVRRNRGGLAVAALVLFFLVLLGSGVGWAARDRSAREAEAAQQRAARQGKVAGQVEAVFAEVDGLEGEQKWPEALAAARRAEAAVAGGEADAETTERVRQRLKDLEFIDRLEQIRMEGLANVPDSANRDQDYARAFRDYGVDVEELAVEASVERLKARPVLVIPLAVALDEWVAIRRPVSKGDVPDWKRLAAIAHGIDPEPLRDRLRSTWGRPVSETQDELRRLADSIDVRAHHPATLFRLGNTLRQAELPDAALRILREAQSVYPGDFWLNTSLGNLLFFGNKDLDGAIRFYTAAVSLRPSAMSAYVNLSDSLRAHGKLDEGIAVCRRAIEINPKNAPYRDLGDYLHAQKKPDEEIAVYRQAIEAIPDSAGYFWRAIGDTLHAQKKPDEAADAYRKAIAAYRQTMEASPGAAGGCLLSIGNALRAQGKPDEAIAVYRQGIEAVPEAADSYLYFIGVILRDQKKPDEAIAAYRQAIEALPERADSYLHSIGDILRDQKKPAEAADAYRKASELKPNDIGHHRSLGLALRDQNKPAEANAAFDRAVELFRKAPDLTSGGIYRNIGRVLRDKGEPDEAIAAFRKAVEADPKDRPAIQDLVKALRDRGRPDEVIDVYRKAVEADPKDFDNQLNLGSALLEQGKLDEANAVCRKAVDLAPTSNGAAAAYLNIGTALYRQKKMPEAIAAYYRVIELDPSDKLAPSAYIDLGFILRDWGKPDEAAAAFRKAIEFNRPDATLGANISLGDVLAEQNKLDDAIAVYRKIIELKSDSPRTCCKLAWILATRPEANLRDPKEALVLARRAVELAPNLDTTWQYLGWIHYRTGDWKSSIEALEKSCELQEGGTGDAGQWIVLALAHARLAAQEGLPDKEREQHRTEARRWFDQADKQIDSRWRVRPGDVVGQAIWDFHAEARELIGTNDNKK